MCDVYKTLALRFIFFLFNSSWQACVDKMCLFDDHLSRTHFIYMHFIIYIHVCDERLLQSLVHGAQIKTHVDYVCKLKTLVTRRPHFLCQSCMVSLGASSSGCIWSWQGWQKASRGGATKDWRHGAATCHREGGAVTAWSSTRNQDAHSTGINLRRRLKTQVKIKN